MGISMVSIKNCGLVRFIPACAGEPTLPRLAVPFPRVYPRVCGGTSSDCIERCHHQRVYPRVCGGTRQWLHSFTMMLRSIPACAGEPESGSGSGRQVMVYPRVCGGTDGEPVAVIGHWGLSPRVRGNRFADGATADGQRSIPACAGEPRVSVLGRRYSRVYPRVCGGTKMMFDSTIAVYGLSPRVRGNRSEPRPPVARSRSIPACAGEPSGP